MTLELRVVARPTHVGIRFANAGPISYCSPGDLLLGIGDYVVVRMDRGDRLGWVVVGADQVLANLVDGPTRVIDRLAAEDDIATWRAQTERANADALRAQAVATRIDARVRIAQISYDLTHTYGELTYTAREFNGEERLHREAVQLLGVSNLQVEQVGDRDRAKALDGLGQCGRGLCCATWMTEFPAISIKMAKDQGLAPNPSKISGACGRLLCCLAFEVDAYREIVGTLPKVGKRITTPIGRAKVISINAMNETVRLRLDDSNQVIELAAETIRRQMGTAIRPEEMDATVEEGIRREDEERKALFLAALEPTDRRAPRRSSRAALNSPGREVRDERPLRDLDENAVPEDRIDEPREPRVARPTRQRPAPSSATARPRRDAPSGGATRGRRDAGDARPPRDAPPRDGAPRDGARTERTTIGGIRVTRRSARPADVAGPTTPRPPRDAAPRDTTPRPPQNETPRLPSEGAPGADIPGESEEQRRRRRRGRRGGRGRGPGDTGGAPESGSDD